MRRLALLVFIVPFGSLDGQVWFPEVGPRVTRESALAARSGDRAEELAKSKKDSPEPPKAVLKTLPVRRATGITIATRDCGSIAIS
jgi:carbamoylphosphate synthase large subunit